MRAEANTTCINCQRLEAQVEALTATIAQLQATLAQVQAQLAAARKDSSTSSKPPSSDIVLWTRMKNLSISILGSSLT